MVCDCGLYFMWPVSCQHSKISQFSWVLNWEKILPCHSQIGTFRLQKAVPSLSFSASKFRKAPKSILVSVSPLWFKRRAEWCARSCAYFCCSFLWCTICSIPSLTSSPHSPLVKLLYAQDFPCAWTTTAGLCSTFWTQSYFRHTSFSATSATHTNSATFGNTLQLSTFLG